MSPYAPEGVVRVPAQAQGNQQVEKLAIWVTISDLILSTYPALGSTEEGECRSGGGKFIAWLLSLSGEEELINTTGRSATLGKSHCCASELIRGVEKLLAIIVTKGDHA